MRPTVLALVLIVALPGTATGQGLAFDDVPPWHWALDAVQKAVSAGIFIGYPTNDAQMATNAVAQVYEAFAHSSHPAAREWAERFLAGTPSTWPEPLNRSRLLAFRLEDVRAGLSGERGTVAFVLVVMLRQDARSTETRGHIRVAVQKDAEGRWRVNYGSLATAQPQLFR